LWSATGGVAQWYDDPLGIWGEWADFVRGTAVPVGHFLPEEAPADTLRHLLPFLD
jgi:haloacetate dehalogenase